MSRVIPEETHKHTLLLIKKGGDTVANDRIYLQCKACGEERMLYKYYPFGEGYANDANILTVFITEHLACSGLDEELDLGGEPGFLLITESGQALQIMRERRN